jgi:hypothetical protein
MPASSAVIDLDPDWPEPHEPAGGSRQHLGLPARAEQDSTATRRVRQVVERLGVSVVDSDQALAAETNLNQLVAATDESLSRSPVLSPASLQMTATHHPLEDMT